MTGSAGARFLAGLVARALALAGDTATTASATRAPQGRACFAMPAATSTTPRLGRRGWLLLLCFLASVAGGALLLARTRGEVQVAAALACSASLSALFGTSALYAATARPG